MPYSKSPSPARTSGSGRAASAKKSAPRAPKGQTSHEVRIIGGQWRRTRLKVLDKPGLRPTPDRVRETLFNWLGQDLTGLRCLDLFAGSGALGFEAASRGAASVTLVEQTPATARSLHVAADTLKDPAIRVVCADALAFLKKPQGLPPLDLVFLDPPYGQGWLDRIIMPLLPHLADGARLYMESEQPLPAQPAPGLSCIKQGKAGQVHYHLYAYALPTGSA